MLLARQKTTTKRYLKSIDFMDKLLNYRKRDKLYQFLIDDFGFVKTDEGYDSKNFGNFYISLSSKDFLLDYINDRSFLDIRVRSKLDPKESISLTFLKSFLYNPAKLNNSDEGLDNKTRIERLNNFLKTDYEKICKLVNENNYLETKTTIHYEQPAAKSKQNSTKPRSIRTTNQYVNMIYLANNRTVFDYKKQYLCQYLYKIDNLLCIYEITNR